MFVIELMNAILIPVTMQAWALSLKNLSVQYEKTVVFIIEFIFFNTCKSKN